MRVWCGTVSYVGRRPWQDWPPTEKDPHAHTFWSPQLSATAA